MEQYFPEFPEKRHLPCEVYQSFEKFLTRDFHSIWLSFRNFWNFCLNGSPFGNWTIFGFSRTFLWKFAHHLSLFQSFWNFCLNRKHPEFLKSLAWSGLLTYCYAWNSLTNSFIYMRIVLEWRETLTIGTTKLLPSEVEDLLRRMGKNYQGRFYHLIDKYEWLSLFSGFSI